MFRCLVTRLAVALLIGVVSVAAVAGPAAPAASPRTIVVFGDSQAQGVAGALQRMFLRDRSYRVIDRTVPGTGLSQKLQFDWVDTIDHWLADDHADVAVVMFGGNDRLAVRLEAGGHAIAYKTDAWKEMYSERLNGVLGLFKSARTPVVWLGQPVAREAEYTDDMAFLNKIFEDTVPAAGGDYLPLWTVIADESGNYAAYGKGLDGETKRLRQDDGIHFTPAGYDIIAVKVKAQIDTLLANPAEAVGQDTATHTPAAEPAPAAPTPAAPVRTVADSAAHS